MATASGSAATLFGCCEHTFKFLSAVARGEVKTTEYCLLHEEEGLFFSRCFHVNSQETEQVDVDGPGESRRSSADEAFGSFHGRRELQVPHSPRNDFGRRRTPSASQEAAQLLSALAGRWVHQNNRQVLEFIEGDMVHGPDGSKARIALLGKDSVTMQLGADTHHARFAGDKLYWDDGDVWVRTSHLVWTARWSNGPHNPLQPRLASTCSSPSSVSRQRANSFHDRSSPTRVASLDSRSSGFGAVSGTLQAAQHQVQRALSVASVAATSSRGSPGGLADASDAAAARGATVLTQMGNTGVCRNASAPTLSRNTSASAVCRYASVPTATAAPSVLTPLGPTCIGSASNAAELAKPTTSARPSNPNEEDEDSPESNGFEGFQGHWKHQACPDIREVIRGDTIHGPDGTQTQMRPHGLFGFKIELNGNTHTAKLVGGQLLWDDGDVWIPEEAPTQFDGRWVHNGNAGIVEVIKSDIIIGPDGTLTPITVTSPDAFCIRLANQAHHARLVGDRLVWDDGDIWVQGGSFDGRYVHKANPAVKEVIKDDVIHGQHGTVIRIDPDSEESFSISLNGAKHQAKLVCQNEIMWDDGDVWILQPEATSSELGDLDDQALWITEVRRLSISREESMAEAAAARMKLELEAKERAESQASQLGSNSESNLPWQPEQLAFTDERVMKENETLIPLPATVEDSGSEETGAGEGTPASGEKIGGPTDGKLLTTATTADLSTTAGSFDAATALSDTAPTTVPSTGLPMQQEQQQQEEQTQEHEQEQKHKQSSADVQGQSEAEAASEEPAVLSPERQQELEQKQCSVAVEDQSKAATTKEPEGLPAASPHLPTAVVPDQAMLSQPPCDGNIARRPVSARRSEQCDGGTTAGDGAKQRAASARPVHHRGAGTTASAAATMSR